MLRLLVAVALVSTCTAQYAQQRPAATSPETMETIPAWYQMPKQQQQQQQMQQMPQAAPSSFYERREPVNTYERIERPAIQHTSSYSGYPPVSYNRQPFESLSSMSTAGSIGNLPSRRYPSASGGSDPNTELLAAIKDVVAKFKASLDEAGIDQDVRLMSSQLRNTWQQLRTGTNQMAHERATGSPIREGRR